jgi:hypothetical protein
MTFGRNSNIVVARDLQSAGTMACRFCGLETDAAPNHPTAAACIRALENEAARLRKLVKGLESSGRINNTQPSAADPHRVGLACTLSAADR